MDELKHRAGEKLEAIHVAARTAANNSKHRAEDVYSHSIETIRKIQEVFHDIWHHELIEESRARVAAWSREAVRRVREGAPLLSPVVLYEELRALIKDRVWRRSMFIFACGVCVGGCTGLMLGLRMARRVPAGPHARALIAHQDQGVILVEDAVTPAAGVGEVLVRVQSFSVSVTDRCVLRGHGAALRALLPHTPVTVSRGFAGVVLDVGHGVTELEMGDEVWGCVSAWSGGAASELLTVRSTRVGKRPRTLSADAAASLPADAVVAMGALAALGWAEGANGKGRRAVVCGAAGGAGPALLQMLAAAGAYVAVLAPPRAYKTLSSLGASELIQATNSHTVPGWGCVERWAAQSGPSDAVLVCAGPTAPAAKPTNTYALLKATAPRNAIVDLRPKAFISDRLPAPLYVVFAVSLYTYRIMRWVFGRGWHTDWLESKYSLRDGLDSIAQLVDSGQLVPILDKVYLPQDFEDALAHACSDDAVGTTVIRFP